MYTLGTPLLGLATRVLKGDTANEVPKTRRRSQAGKSSRDWRQKWSGRASPKNTEKGQFVHYCVYSLQMENYSETIGGMT